MANKIIPKIYTYFISPYDKTCVLSIYEFYGELSSLAVLIDGDRSTDLTVIEWLDRSVMRDIILSEQFYFNDKIVKILENTSSNCTVELIGIDYILSME